MIMIYLMFEILYYSNFLYSFFHLLTTVVYTLVRGIPAVWCPITELLVIHTLVPSEAEHLVRTT